jgi:hypothetical protein
MNSIIRRLFYDVSVVGLGIVTAVLLLTYTPVAYDYTVDQLRNLGYLEKPKVEKGWWK